MAGVGQGVNVGRDGFGSEAVTAVVMIDQRGGKNWSAGVANEAPNDRDVPLQGVQPRIWCFGPQHVEEALG